MASNVTDLAEIMTDANAKELRLLNDPAIEAERELFLLSNPLNDPMEDLACY